MMNKPLISILLLSLSWLAGCASPPLIVGQPRPAVASEDVVVYYVEQPYCNFETIAYLQATGGYLSLGSMVGELREQAAELGADGLFVQHTQQLGLKEFLGTAKAIRCLQA